MGTVVLRLRFVAAMLSILLRMELTLLVVCNTVIGMKKLKCFFIYE